MMPKIRPNLTFTMSGMIWWRVAIIIYLEKILVLGRPQQITQFRHIFLEGLSRFLFFNLHFIIKNCQKAQIQSLAPPVVEKFGGLKQSSCAYGDPVWKTWPKDSFPKLMWLVRNYEVSSAMSLTVQRPLSVTTRVDGTSLSLWVY